MDTTGAFIGPILALIYLKFYPGEYQKLFFYSLIPAIFVAILLYQVKEKYTEGKKGEKNLFIESLTYWKEASASYKEVVLIILGFTLINSSDMFLLLKAREVLGSDVLVVACYIFYNFIYASSSYPMGILSDKIGQKKVFVIGLLFFASTYLLIGFSQNSITLFAAFLLYGLYAASTEGVSKAWISSLCKKEDLGVALGFQSTTQSICAMIASIIAGLLWTNISSQSVFIFSGIGSIIIALLISFKKSLFDKKLN
jgi:MFS family permease